MTGLFSSEHEVLIECLILCSIAAFFFPRLGNRWFRRVELLGSRLAVRKRLAIFSIVGLAILARLSFLGIDPVPVPQVHDEFSYLLAGDTFAHVRLTNPPHPMSVFFDTFHVNQHPTYMSKYPPSQGAALALGERLGNPWIGVLLSVGAMCGAILWMLQGWLPARWALLGALLVLLRFGLFNYWIDSYWGGAVAATGGALVMGAIPRILRRQRPRDALLLGLGAAILANSRPFEGFVLCLTVACFLGVWLIRRASPPWRISLPRVILPLFAMLILTAAFIGYYNWRVSGNPFVLPFTINNRTYMTTPLFIWQKARAPLQYANQQFSDFYNDDNRGYWMFWFQSGMHRLLEHTVEEIRVFLYAYFEPQFILLLIAIPCVLRGRKMRFPFAQFLFCLLASLTSIWFWPHYVAPLTATVFLLVVQALRYLRRWEFRGRPIGVGLSRVIVLFTVAMIPLHAIEAIRNPQSLSQFETRMPERATIAAQLEAMPGKQLVIVRYSDDHDPNEEWVYNRADIDRAKVVWAREIPDLNIQPLLEYFRTRTAWLVEPDASPPRLYPYSANTE
jgi:hypothetical protein